MTSITFFSIFELMNIGSINRFKDLFKRLFHNDLFSALGAGFLIAVSWKVFSDCFLDISDPEDLDWHQYYSLITLLPLSVVMISFIKSKGWLFYVKVFLIVFYFASILVLYWSLYNFLLSFCSSLLFIFFLRRSGYSKENILFLFVTYNSFFLIISRIAWWQDLGVLVAGDLYTFIVFFLILALSVFCILRADFENISQEKYFTGILKTTISLCVFFVAAIACRKMNLMQIHHWGCYTGTAELIRQGGYLLWSVPSQYGFLSILSIAFFPLESCWEAFWTIQLIFLVSSSMMVFYVLYSFSKTKLNYILSLITTLCAVFLFPGWVPDLLGVNYFPSVGPFRFFWLYSIIFFIVIQWQRKFIKNQKYENYFGSFIWIIGCLWSFESAYYVSFVWFFYLFFNSLVYAEGKGQKGIIKTLCQNFIIPALFFLTSASMICCFYWIIMSELPDIYSYVEHALSFKSGFGGLSMSLRGGFGLLLLILVFIIADIVYIYRTPGCNKKVIPFLAALYAGLWAFISYFVGRSHENNISNLIPLIVFITGSLLLIRKKDGMESATLFKLAAIQLYTIIVTLTIGNFTGLRNFLPIIKTENINIESTLPDPDPEISAAMVSAGITLKDSIIYIDKIILLGNNKNERYHYWLPVNPATIYDPLNKERTKIYIQRFSRQFRSGGYLITRGDDDYLKIESAIQSFYDPIGPAYRIKDIYIQRYTLKK